MIFYFSGTGNSAWVAQQLAHLTEDNTCDITALTQRPDVHTAKQIGFVFPVYAWGAPEVMIDFAKNLQRCSAFVFGVCTCGGEAGLTMKSFSQYYPLDSSYSVVMPNNYIIGSDTDDGNVIVNKLTTAREALQQMAQEILRQERVYRVHEGTLAGIKSGVANWGFNKFARSAKPFFATERCNGCGLCAQHCPASAITLQLGRPVWKEQCYKCMRCINTCPQQAIEYGKATAGRHRYAIRPYLPLEEHC